ncbi:TAT-variant-translocated molybdopterin oxidoreductase [Xanthovirga aplysinae]|uniref:TAT-variant-translocated molybdopterin oxidoreductase n=1 Tax=Xanthovirga aplysinae TaxID=2529853 RepID=UPI0012BBBD27|nr:TAT-variant-translocated molybdopterin oxidoreductase [Xanthovirga aplysinae]MTI33286.1 4Fe-4S dicluster domain-containing protein [Xanthovirga aplysinae]
MKDNKKTYWKGLEQLTNDPEFVKRSEKEFPEYLPIAEKNEEGGSSRRDFLKMMGFGIAAASLAACEAPVRKAIPYLNKPVDVDPGVPNYYASTYANGGDYCSIVVKTREGRPIKIEGNKLSKITKGGVSAQVEASVLSLYDKERLQGPLANGKKISWEDLDKEIIKELDAIASRGGQIRIVSNTVLSPTTKAAIAELNNKYGKLEHVVYDPQSSYGMVLANEKSFGKAVIPSYDFSKAEVIVGVGADFLGTWLSPVEFTKQYSKTRKVSKKKPEMSRHFQFESNLSLTGSNADYRTTIKPSQEGQLVAALYNLIAKKAGAPAMSAGKGLKVDNLEKAAKELWANRGKGLVVASSNDEAVQMTVNAINNLLGNYGSTIDLNLPVNYRQGDDKAMAKFVKDLQAGRVQGVIFFNSNPVYDYKDGAAIGKALSKVKLTIATNDRMDETTSLVKYVAPDHHFLESWNDAEPKPGHYSLSQPSITPLFKTRQAGESFLAWAGNKTEFYSYLNNRWKSDHFPQQSKQSSFDTFWKQSLYDGVFEVPVKENAVFAFAGNLSGAASAINKNYKTNNSGVEVILYQKVGIGSGNQANNPWLQEMPDPITKATWDNYLTVSQSWANENGIKVIEENTVLANVTVGNQSFKVPVIVQPGQADGTVGLALGYGRTKAGKVANGVGVNVYPLANEVNGTVNYTITSGVKIEATTEAHTVARTQTHETYMERHNVIQETVLSEYKKDPKAGLDQMMIATSQGTKKATAISLWKGHKQSYNNHHWMMAIDMNACTGCGACTVACQVENNVPVVGRDEVINRREMHWIRIDRYYSSDAAPEDLQGLEVASKNPEVTFQPVMCQQCNNAPCETVCPVAATTHSTEGLNMMAYNRCIGTRYCANNCPYKVRRFNWFKYFENDKFDKNTPMNNDLGRMVLNPDVVVRSRGVMEKCTFCVQRIQYGKLSAKKEGRRPTDEDINTACAQACPADAIVFGDVLNPESKVAKIMKEEEEGRAYAMLEELNVSPNVYYLRKVRNKDTQKNKA